LSTSQSDKKQETHSQNYHLFVNYNQLILDYCGHELYKKIAP